VGDSLQAVTSHRLRVARPEHKFSCAHMTVFDDSRKERLHGHNYQLDVELELRDIGFASMVELSLVKDAAAALCDEWKEHLLLAKDNPHLEVIRWDRSELEFRLCGDRYVVPADDVLLLPIDNVTIEALAAHAAALLAERLAPRVPAGVVTALSVTVAESPGQEASCRRSF
jgi:6-pyruvoyltetrahydropterin/6-carboxytetrahydropterin synthase